MLRYTSHYSPTLQFRLKSGANAMYNTSTLRHPATFIERCVDSAVLPNQQGQPESCDVDRTGQSSLPIARTASLC
jgi:hypothetical protein